MKLCFSVRNKFGGFNMGLTMFNIKFHDWQMAINKYSFIKFQFAQIYRNYVL